MRLVRLLFTAAALAALTGSAIAAPATFKFDRNHSSVGFQIRHFFAKVPGKFTDYDGKLVIDPENLGASSVEVTIQAASINTGNDHRDNDLRSDNFFDVEKFPTLTFKSTKVVPGEGNTFKIEGDLTMLGISKPVVLDVENLGMGNFASGDRNMGTRAGFEATTTINRKDWGINWNRTFDQGGAMLGDDVKILIGVEAVKQEAEAAGTEKKAAMEKKGGDAKAEKAATK